MKPRFTNDDFDPAEAAVRATTETPLPAARTQLARTISQLAGTLDRMRQEDGWSERELEAARAAYELLNGACHQDNRFLCDVLREATSRIERVTPKKRRR